MTTGGSRGKRAMPPNVRRRAFSVIFDTESALLTVFVQLKLSPDGLGSVVSSPRAGSRQSQAANAL